MKTLWFWTVTQRLAEKKISGWPRSCDCCYKFKSGRAVGEERLPELVKIPLNRCYPNSLGSRPGVTAATTDRQSMINVQALACFQAQYI